MSRLMEDFSSFPSTAFTSQEDHENSPGSTSSRKLRVTLLSSEWRSTKGGLSTINRELAIQLAKHPRMEVSIYLPQCSEEDKRVAASHSVTLIEAEKRPGLEPELWLSCLPKDHVVDCVIGHGAVLGRQVQIIKHHHRCKWIQVVHTAPEELGMYKGYEEHISKGEKKHQVEIELCKLADEVVAVGPKLAEAFSGYLRPCGKDQDVLNLTPGIFSEFADVKQASQERSSFSVLVFGRGDSEDFQLKGYDIAAQAIAELKDTTYKLVFVGATSGEEEKVADLLLKYGIDRSQLRVRRFNESREKLAQLFCEVDLAIMPSRTEGFGLAALEALSAGLPVLVSGNSGIGEALKKVSFGSNCVVKSENPKDWANAIRIVREKDREMRLDECKTLREKYAMKHNWRDDCTRLVERMLSISGGPNTDEQNLPKKAPVICQDEKASSAKSLHKGTAKRSKSSKKAKRPLSSSNTPASKYPRLLRDEGTENAVVVKLLTAEYKRRSKLKPLSWCSTIQLPLENVYTRLKIVSRRKADFQVENVEVGMYDVFKAPGEVVMTHVEGSSRIILPYENPVRKLNVFETEHMKLQGGNDEVGMYDIFKALDKGEDVMTLVEGSPGIGKTTFCLKLAYDWARETVPANSSFPKLQFVLLLKCRDIDKDIMETIKEQLLPEDMEEETWTKFSAFIKDIHNQEKILIILDGLDELPENSQHFVDKLLCRRILPFCYILVTSRQEKGIDARKNFDFDLLLEIKGFTEDDAYVYIKKHFQNVCPKRTSKGEMLIKELKGNTLLNALRNNPLNLLLLCVVYEDYEGKLPTSRTELYKVIVRCLLRRYCEKHNAVVPEDEIAVEKRFEEDILTLGELAWRCLRNDRQSFLEKELVQRERRNKNLVARTIGLLYKEESLKRICPQHEYWFLHKTFQEYFAALYIAHRLRGNQLNLFECISFYDLVSKYPEVFLFVSGTLGREASILFTQIGEELKYWGRWDWYKCSSEAATFFVKSLRESGYAERIGVTLCSFVPFPTVLNMKTADDNSSTFKYFLRVLDACKGFSSLQTSVAVVTPSYEINAEFLVQVIVSLLQSCSQLKTVDLFMLELTSSHVTSLFQELCSAQSLSELSLKVIYRVSSDAAVLIGKGLAACGMLRRVIFALPGEDSEACFHALETGLCADNPLTSVALEVYGSMTSAAMRALEKLLSNKSLNSLSLRISGSVQDLLASAVSEAIGRQTVLKSVDLQLDGKLSSSGANFLEEGLTKNSSLNYIRVFVHGEVPGNWQSVVGNLRLAKKSPVTCVFYPNTWTSVAGYQMAHFRPVLVEEVVAVKQHLTMNIWGELSCKGSEALVKVLESSSLSLLTLNVRGNLTDDVLISIASGLKGCNTLSSIIVNIWGELTTEGGTVLSDPSVNNLGVQVKVRNVRVGPDESDSVPSVSVDKPESLTSLFARIKDTGKEVVSLKIDNCNNNGAIKEWTNRLGDALEDTSVALLDLRISNCEMGVDLANALRETFSRSTLLTALSLTINNCKRENWGDSLVESLAKLASLTSLSLKFHSASDHSDTIHKRSLGKLWGSGVFNFLMKCQSLKKLCVTLNSYFGINFEYDDFGLNFGLKETSSLNTLEMTMCINHLSLGETFLLNSLGQGLSLNNSLTTLTLIVNVHGVWENTPKTLTSFSQGLAKNKSLTTLSLTVKEYGKGKSFVPWFLRVCGVFKGLAQNTSIATFNLELNSSKEVSDNWLPSLCDALKKNTSLTTLRLQVNNHCAGESHLYDLSKRLIECRSLSLLELEVSFYGKESD